MARHSEHAHELTLAENRVTLSGPADLADALPYLLGYHPDDSIVVMGLHGPRGRLGGRIRTGIPADPAGWCETAESLAACLVDNSAVRDSRPDAAVVYLCQEPPDGVPARETMERLRPLAQRLRTACGGLEVPVLEALYVAGGRYWSYCCAGDGCCPDEGNELPRTETSPMAAAAAYAGIRVRGSLRQFARRLAPLGEPAAARQVRAFDQVAAKLFGRMLSTERDTAGVRAETLELAGLLMSRFRRALAAPDPDDASSDARDDALLTSEEAARLVLGLQDRVTRDIAAEWMEGADAPVALRLWRALARRCVAEYEGHGAAPLTLAGWVAWSSGDETEARVALERALEADPEYVFARLLHQACNEGVDPEALRRCMRQQRAARGR
ncbi:DUF4192 domain-containing protein [Streptomyces litchfieldiae]|uniref:DUF4192 domain-containing protein n=1 Tax=Streptomyces litchfieldiae TaxID=3075543 RepID=A0ABU2MZC9_9ACTN|nr:DUF4192 domain-containing protein [Streptomyces sp. DSM 44938]MDT0346633.1 DUF4192 domain-containing protein [Streptomyces sp. DSM 44938]